MRQPMSETHHMSDDAVSNISVKKLSFRRLLPTDDIQAITELLHEAYASLAAAGMRYVASHQSADVTRERMANGETFIAALGDRIIGTVTLKDAEHTAGSPFYDRPNVADFGQFAVAPAFQHQGIGSRMMEMVEARAHEKGVHELALNTSEHAAHLIELYTRKGYRFVEYVRWPDVNYRSMIFSKTLR